MRRDNSLNIKQFTQASLKLLIKNPDVIMQNNTNRRNMAELNLIIKYNSNI